jgi:hypothetical protein
MSLMAVYGDFKLFIHMIHLARNSSKKEKKDGGSTQGIPVMLLPIQLSFEFI